MASLAINFAGLALKNPVVMASAPPTETVESIMRCAEAGAAAAVTKTIADFDEESFPLGARRARIDQSGLWALSTFRRETLTLESGTALVAGAVRQAGIPIIASVGALTMDPESWLPTCLAVQAAGASMIQLDLFYVPHPRCSPKSVEQLRTLLKALAGQLKIPLAPKLNLDLPAHYAADVLRDAPIAALFAIDSIRVPPPLDLVPRLSSRIAHAPNAGECSLFGSWQKPITLQYTRTLAERLPMPVCAGGGLMTGLDAIEAMALGATTVQFATAVIRGGFKRITSILGEMEKYLDSAGYADISQVRGMALSHFAADEREIRFGNIKAKVDHDICIMCGKCTTVVFCPDIHVANGRIEVLDHCDGCGLCVEVCPTKPVKSLSVVSAAHD
ncbi:MAG: 4Fe-4S binding protein [Verrucomicrobia bacterium]|nr:4Fe-4S binding protein [Verrucomicrobiota bacterium]